MSKVRALLLVLLVVGVPALGLYLYGWSACPPPEWWVRLFLRSGNFGCVQ